MLTYLDILDFVSIVIEILTIVFFGHLFLQKRNHYNFINILLVVVCIAADVFLSFFNIPLYINLMKSFLEFFIIIYVIYKIPLWNITFLSIVNLLLIGISDVVIASILTYILDSNFYIISYETTGRVIGMYMSDLFIFLMLYFVSILAKKKMIKLPLKYRLIILLYPILCYCLIMIINWTMMEAEITNPLFIVFPMLILMYIIFAIFDFFDAYSSKLELEILTVLNEQKQENYRILEKSNEEIRILKHDINKHLDVISEKIKTINNHGADEYINEVRKNYDEYRDYIYTNNETFDTVINTECKKAKSYGVEFSCFVGFNANLTITSADTTVLFINLIDNAIEASVETDKPFVSVYITQQKNDLLIDIKNSSLDRKFIGKADLLTTKESKHYHGYGLKSVKSVVEKYKGSINMTFQNGIFETNVVLKECCLPRF